MTIIFLILFHLLLQINNKFFNRTNNKFIYIVLGLISSSMFFIDNSFGLDILKINISDKIFALSFIITSSIYYLLLILNEQKKDFIINKNEPLFLAVLLISVIPLKFTLILGICVFESIKWSQDRKIVPIKVILISIYLVLLLQNSIVISGIVFIVGLFAILMSFVFSTNKKIEIYIIPLLTSLTLLLKPHLSLGVVALYIGTFVMYFKYKLTTSNFVKLNSFLTKYHYIEKYIIIMKMKSNRSIVFYPNDKQLEIVERKYKKAKPLEHLSDGKLTYIYLFSLILLSILLGVLK